MPMGDVFKPNEGTALLQVLDLKFCANPNHDHFMEGPTARYPTAPSPPPGQPPAKRARREANEPLQPWEVKITSRFLGYPVINLGLAPSSGVRTICTILTDRLVNAGSKKYFPQFAEQPSLTFNAEDNRLVLTLPPLSQLIVEQGFDIWLALGFPEELFQTRNDDKVVINENAGASRKIVANELSGFGGGVAASAVAARGGVTLKKLYSDWLKSKPQSEKSQDPPDTLVMGFMPLYNPFVYSTTFPRALSDCQQSATLVKRYFRLLLSYLREIWNFEEGSLEPEFRQIGETAEEATWNIGMPVLTVPVGGVQFQLHFRFGSECKKILGLSKDDFTWAVGEPQMELNVSTKKTAVFSGEQQLLLDNHVFVQNEGTHPRLSIAKEKMKQLIQANVQDDGDGDGVGEDLQTAEEAPPEQNESETPAAGAAPAPEIIEADRPPAVQPNAGEAVTEDRNEEGEEGEETGEEAEEPNIKNENSVFFYTFPEIGDETKFTLSEPCSMPTNFPENYVLMLREAETSDFVRGIGLVAVLGLVGKAGKQFPPVSRKNWGKHETLQLEIVDSSNMQYYRPSPPNQDGNKPIYVQIDLCLTFVS